MTKLSLENLQSQISGIQSHYAVGRVLRLEAGRIVVAGLGEDAAIGDLVEIDLKSGARISGEILQINQDDVIVLPDNGLNGLSTGLVVRLIGPAKVAPDDSWLGRIVDPYGNPLDGRPILAGATPRDTKGTPLPAVERRGLGGRLETGLAAFNTLLPLVRGQRVGLFAGSGVGKSMLMGKLARGIEADVVVISLIGERGREVRDFVERIIGKRGMKRTVVVAATSDQSALCRRRAAETAMTVAEHFRDKGSHVLFMADSITRFAEAHREVAVAAGEIANLREFPPSTAHRIASLCERAGPGAGNVNDITAVFTVLVAGSDMEGPVADMLRGVLDGHVVLDRTIAERGRFPAIDLLRSVSRSLPDAASPIENRLIALARRRIGSFENAEMMVQAGLYERGSDPEIDAALRVWPKLDAFLAEDERETSAESFKRLEACLGGLPD